MRRFTSLSLLVLLILLAVAAPAGAKFKAYPEPVGIGGGAFTEITTTAGSSGRAVGVGFGELTLGEFDEAVSVVMTQSYAGWNGKHPADLLGETTKGEITITAENGDVLVGTYRGEVDEIVGDHDADLPLVWARSELTFRRGTGQFRGVTGSVQVDVGRCFSYEVMGFGIMPGATVSIR
jgi:hypothetical protein